MARNTTALTDQEIKNAIGKEKTYKLMDGLGLYLQITPSGSKAWRFRYRMNNKERTMSFGSYPEVTLKDARGQRDATRSKIALGIDPLKEKQDLKDQQLLKDMQDKNTFEKVVLEYLEHKEEVRDIVPASLLRLKQRFDIDCMGAKSLKAEIQSLKELGKSYGIKQARLKEIKKNLDISTVPFAEVTEEQIREILANMKKRGSVISARRFHANLAKLFEWAREMKYIKRGVATVPEMISRDLALPLRDRATNYPIIDDKATLGVLLRDIDSCLCEYPTKQALKILPHLAVRPSNLRSMRWDEIDFDQKLWIIPKGKMKKKTTHVVPLTDYVIGVLNETRGYSGAYDLVFPSHRSKKELSNGTFNYALKKISNGKYKVVGHSFRGIFSTFANNNLEFDSRVIDVALAHSLSSAVEKAYNRADYLDQRRDLMQWWTDFLLEVKNA